MVAHITKHYTATAKTATFALVHFSVAFSVAYFLTGSVAISSAIALVEPACNTFAYFLHEKAWQRAASGATPSATEPSPLPA